MRIRLFKEDSGQALIEVSVAAVALCVLILGIVDFGRAIYDVQVIKNLAGEGSSMASRGTSTATTVQTVANYAGSNLNMASNGCIIETIVSNSGGTPTITDQAYNCPIGTKSKVGCLVGVNGCQSSTPTVPAAVTTALTTEVNGSNIAITEIYYNFSTITPITSFLGSNAVPSQFYTAAYY